MIVYGIGVGRVCYPVIAAAFHVFSIRQNNYKHHVFIWYGSDILNHKVLSIVRLRTPQFIIVFIRLIIESLFSLVTVRVPST
jgi:hypothetical protein